MSTTTAAPAVAGFSFPVVTDAGRCPVLVVGLGGTPRLREGKASPEGEATYATGAVLMGERQGELSPMKAASVHVIEAAPTYELGRQYRAQGRVYVQPYTPDGGRMTVSITVERLVPVETRAAD